MLYFHTGTRNWTQSWGHNRLSTESDPTDLSLGQHSAENQLFFCRTCLCPIAWRDFPSLCATIAARFAASIGSSVLPMSLALSLLCASSDGMGRRPWENRGGCCWSHGFPRLREGSWAALGLLCWQSSTLCWSYRPPLVALGGTPQATWTKATRHLAFSNSLFSPDEWLLYLKDPPGN